jgi:hypothetical protein
MRKLLILLFLLSFKINAQNDTCDIFDVQTDKFKGSTRFYSDTYSGIDFVKYISKEKVTTHYIALEVIGSTLNVGEKGVIILLNDGKINKPLEKIDVDYKDEGYRYSVLIPLTKQDIEKLKKSRITDFQLYIYEKNVLEGDQLKLLKTFNCLLQAKIK